MAKTLVLASASPRRKELLQKIGIDPVIMPVEVEELTEGMEPEKIVLENAKRKARKAAEKTTNTILAADTLVVLDDKIMGKPRSEAEAYSILKFLSGKIHHVLTGMVVIEDNAEKSLVVETKVKFFPLSKNEIWDYIHTKEPMDKAGAYGIQGRAALFVEWIEGDYNNIVGLPVGQLRQLMTIKDYLNWEMIE